MTPEEITQTLTDSFEPSMVQSPDPSSWQVETPQWRLLVLLSEDQTWLRMLIPIAPASEAQPFFEQLLEANFDATQESRYAISREVLWGVFQHSLANLSVEDFKAASDRLISLRQQGLSPSFDQFADSRIRQIIQVAKLQGQSLEATMQTLDRFYEEGLMGGLEQTTPEREQVLAAWRRRLESLWSEVD
jgi:hypothetical protein